MPRKTTPEIVYKYHHVGIPTKAKKSGMIDIPHLGICASDHGSNPFGIQWMLYRATCPVPQLVRKVPHVAFEVKDLKAALKGKKVLIEPNSPSPGVLVAFVEESGAPVELLQFTPGHADKNRRRRLKKSDAVTK